MGGKKKNEEAVVVPDAFRVTHKLQRNGGKMPEGGAVPLMCLRDDGDGTGLFVDADGEHIEVERSDVFVVDASVSPPRLERNLNAPMIVRA